MVRARRILEVIESDELIDAGRVPRRAPAARSCSALAEKHDIVSDVRGRGLMCAFTLPSAEMRDAIVTKLREDEHVMMLGCGTSSLRVRPALTISIDEIDRGIAALDRVLASI